MFLCGFILQRSRVDGGRAGGDNYSDQVRVLCGLGQSGGDGGGSKVVRAWIYLEDRACGI